MLLYFVVGGGITQGMRKNVAVLATTVHITLSYGTAGHGDDIYFGDWGTGTVGRWTSGEWTAGIVTHGWKTVTVTAELHSIWADLSTDSGNRYMKSL